MYGISSVCPTLLVYNADIDVLLIDINMFCPSQKSSIVMPLSRLVASLSTCKRPCVLNVSVRC